MAQNRVRIADVADSLGLSTATVSKVIHGKTEKISDETVKRVQQELERSGYIPNMAGILLARNNSRIIGVVVNDNEKYEGRVLEDGFVMSSLNALSHEVNEKGYFLMIKTTSDISEIPVFASMWNMDGLILMGFCEVDYEKLRNQMRISFVVYDGYFEKMLLGSKILCIRKDKDKPVWSLHFSKITIKDYLIMIMPILISEFLWSLGQNVESAVYGHLGKSNLAAYTLTCPIQGLIVGALSGLSAAAGVMVGKRLGRKEYDEAYTESKKIMYAGLAGAVAVSTLLILLAGVYTGLYRVDDSVKALGKILLIVFALYAPVKVENMILGGGIVRSGGNTKIIMVIDIVGTWCIGIPLCLLAAYVFKWGIVGVYTLLTTEEIFRLVVSLVIFKRRKWMISLSN